MQRQPLVHLENEHHLACAHHVIELSPLTAEQPHSRTETSLLGFRGEGWAATAFCVSLHVSVVQEGSLLQLSHLEPRAEQKVNGAARSAGGQSDFSYRVGIQCAAFLTAVTAYLAESNLGRIYFDLFWLTASEGTFHLGQEDTAVEHEAVGTHLDKSGNRWRWMLVLSWLSDTSLCLAHIWGKFSPPS